MAAISDFLEPLLLDEVFNGVAITPPATHVALFTTAVGDDGSGTEVASLFGYVRVLVNTNVSATPPKWALAIADGVGFVVDNVESVIWPVATGGDWGTITDIGIYDAATVGNLLWHGALDEPVIITDGIQFSLLVGALNVRLE